MKVLILCHADLIPPRSYRSWSRKRIDNQPWRTEGFVALALHDLNHDVAFCGLDDSLAPLRARLKSFQPGVVFNLLEEFDGEAVFEPMIVSYLQSLGIRTTGGSARELLITKNKLATKALLDRRRVRTPAAHGWPRIVKYVAEESSRGISERAVVLNQRELQLASSVLKRKLKARVFSEEFVPGRELHCGLLVRKNRLVVSGLLETDFGKKPGQKILTEKAKWDFGYRRRMGIVLKPALELSAKTKKEIRCVLAETASALELRGPARVDLRLDSKSRPYVIEVNSNPDLAEGDEFAKCFEQSGISYRELIANVLAGAFCDGSQREDI